MTTLPQLLAATLDRHHDRPAILSPEGTFTWAEFGDRVARAASVLQIRGAARGERFGILMRNGFRYAELLWAGYWLGAIPVPINWRLAPPEIAEILDDAGCRLLAYERALDDRLAAPDLAPWRDRSLLVGTVDQAPGTDNYEALLGDADPLPLTDYGPDEDAILIYTGGTTGRSKGVRLSHRSIICNAEQIGEALGPRADDVFLHVGPMFHSIELIPTAWIEAGAAQAYVRVFTPEAFLSMVERFRVTAFTMPPTLMIMVLTHPDLDRYDLSSLRLYFFGASPMAVEWMRRVADTFPSVEFSQGYGLTESSTVLTVFDAVEFRAAVSSGASDGIVRSVGKPLRGVTMAVVDNEGRPLPQGAVGELTASGPNLMTGYHNRPDETGVALRRGTLFTGDVGRIDEQGYVYLLDRKKDMVITGGENVYTSEVEAALYQHAAVHEAAVFGLPDDRMGETIAAAIVTRPGADVTVQELIDHCRGRIGGYKIPRRIEFVEELEKSPLGKVLKHRLREKYGRGTGRT